MAKCPECGSEIPFLNMYEKREQKRRAHLTSTGQYYTVFVDEYSTEDLDFECPECNELITHDEDDAIRFLKGETMLDLPKTSSGSDPS